MFRLLVIMLVVAGSLAPQNDTGLELLGRVRQHMRTGVTGLPNYTCQETMERSIQDPAGKIEFRERSRLEVLVTGAGELLAWPGSGEFTSEPLEGWIGAGAIGTGNFEADLHNLFVGSAPSLTYAGPETLGQRPLHRFNFRAPLLSSRYTLSVNGQSAITAYSGSFWVERQSLDIIRLETRAEEIPPYLDCSAAHETVTYGRVRLGVDERLLPSSAELTMIRREGIQSRNSITFGKCSHFGAEASLSFTSPLEHPAQAQPRRAVELPSGLTLVLRLEDPTISTRESAAGDQITARLDKAVTTGALSLPKGTRVFGRIRRLEQHLKAPQSILVGVQFFALEVPQGRVIFKAHLTGPRATPYAVSATNLGRAPEIVPATGGLEIEDEGTTTGVGIFRVPGKDLRLQPGFRTVWKTQ